MALLGTGALLATLFGGGFLAKDWWESAKQFKLQKDMQAYANRLQELQPAVAQMEERRLKDALEELRKYRERESRREMLLEMMKGRQQRRMAKIQSDQLLTMLMLQGGSGGALSP